jgi:hypothetical protein
VQRFLKTRNLRHVLRSDVGAIDLASIMVGVIVIGVIAGIIAATVFAVIPWSQDSAAKQGLDAVRTAEGVAYVQDGSYQNFAGLRSSDRIQASTEVNVATDAEGTCYVSVARSASGAVYPSTNRSPDVTLVSGTASPGCVTDAQMTALITGVGGTVPLATALIAVGSNHVVSLDSTGRLWAWGSDVSGQLGNDAALANQPTPSAVAGDRTYAQVSAGIGHTVALDSAGYLWAWGSDGNGQLGNDATLTNQAVPVAVDVSRKYTQVSAGNYHAVALDSTGHLWAWGRDSEGQLGNDASFIDQRTPVAVAGGHTFTQVAAGGFHTIALDSTGHLWAWGDDSYGQLGDDAAILKQAMPVAVDVNRTYTRVAAGENHTLALDGAGGLWAWGYDLYGQLGNDSATANQSLPVAVAGGRKYTQMDGGQNHSAAVDSAGQMWTWGRDAYGQLGNDAAFAQKTIPVPVDGVRQYKQVSAGGNVTAGIDSAGRAFAWGDDASGQLGNDVVAVKQALPVSVLGW